MPRPSLASLPRPPRLRTRWRAVLLLAAGLALAGCPAGAPPPPVPGDDAVVSDRLAAAAASAAEAARRLAGIHAFRNPVVASPGPPATVPAALAIALYLSWTGPLPTIARYLAERAGWDFTTAGPRPARPIIVSIDSDGARLVDLLWDIGQQAGPQVLVDVDVAAGRIALIYPGHRP